jgi:hypothetical protein
MTNLPILPACHAGRLAVGRPSILVRLFTRIYSIICLSSSEARQAATLRRDVPEGMYQRHAQCLLTSCLSVEHLADTTGSTLYCTMASLPQEPCSFLFDMHFSFLPGRSLLTAPLFSMDGPNSQHRRSNHSYPISLFTKGPLNRRRGAALRRCSRGSLSLKGLTSDGTVALVYRIGVYRIDSNTHVRPAAAQESLLR